EIEPIVIDVDALQERLNRPEFQLLKQSLHDVGFGEGLDLPVEEGVDLLATYAGQASFLNEFLRGAEINTDRNLRLQYLAGMWLDTDMREQILGRIRASYRFPEKTFVGSPKRIDALKQIRYLPVRWWKMNGDALR